MQLLMIWYVHILCNTYHINMAVFIIYGRKEAIEGNNRWEG